MGCISVTHAGLTNGKVGKAKGVNRKGNARSYLEEAFGADGEPRKTQSVTYDASRTSENETWYRDPNWKCGKDIYDYLNEELRNWREPITFTKGKAAGVTSYRKARKDKVFADMIVFKPSADVMKQLPTKKDKINLLKCCLITAQRINPKYFKENLLAWTIHLDEENPHLHGLVTTRDGDKWSSTCFPPLDIYAHQIGENFNRVLREVLIENQKAFSVDVANIKFDDYDLLDRERYENDEEYRSARREKHAENGLSANQYIARQERKKNEEQAKMIEELKSEIAVMEADKLSVEAIKKTNESLKTQLDANQTLIENQKQTIEDDEYLLNSKNATGNRYAKNTLRLIENTPLPTNTQEAFNLVTAYEQARATKPKIAHKWDVQHPAYMKTAFEHLGEWQESIMERLGEPENAMTLSDEEISLFLQIRDLRKKWNKKEDKKWRMQKMNGVGYYKYLIEINKEQQYREFMEDEYPDELEQQETQEQPEPQGMMARQKDLNERLAISEEKRNQALGKMAATRQRMEQSRKMDYSRSNDGMEF